MVRKNGFELNKSSARLLPPATVVYPIRAVVLPKAESTSTPEDAPPTSRPAEVFARCGDRDASSMCDAGVSSVRFPGLI